jgi:hypothetical protein
VGFFCHFEAGRVPGDLGEIDIPQHVFDIVDPGARCIGPRVPKRFGFGFFGSDAVGDRFHFVGVIPQEPFRPIKLLGGGLDGVLQFHFVHLGVGHFVFPLRLG